MNIDAEKIGTVSVTIYKNKTTGASFFYVKSSNEDVLQVSYVIEDTLYHF